MTKNNSKKIGDLFEAEVEKANDIYRKLGIALIQKIPTPTTVIRGKGGRIVNAFHNAKSTLDYTGIFKDSPVMFDAKRSIDNRFPLSNVHDHQYEYLKEFVEVYGGVGFLIVGMIKHEQVFLLPFEELKFFWERRENNTINGKAKTGTASISIEEFRDRALLIDDKSPNEFSKKGFINYKPQLEQYIKELK